MEKSSKDVDMLIICNDNLKKIEKIIDNMETIQYINE
jgi:hypothetical protein